MVIGVLEAQPHLPPSTRDWLDPSDVRILCPVEASTPVESDLERRSSTASPALFLPLHFNVIQISSSLPRPYLLFLSFLHGPGKALTFARGIKTHQTIEYSFNFSFYK
jgi:hypothetical protein